jgi:hypothetical protein
MEVQWKKKERVLYTFSGAHLFCILSKLKGINHFLYIAIYEAIQIVHGFVYPVVGDSPLRPIIGSNLGRTVATAY